MIHYCGICGFALGPTARVAHCPDCLDVFCSMKHLSDHRELGTCPKHADGAPTSPTEEPRPRLSDQVAANVRAMRKRRGMSQQALADALAAEGVILGRNVLANWEAGRRGAIGVDELAGLAAVFEVEPWSLTEVHVVLTDEDAAMLAEQWEAAGGNPPALDMSWLQTEEIGGGPPAWLLVTFLLVVVVVAATGWVWFP